MVECIPIKSVTTILYSVAVPHRLLAYPTDSTTLLVTSYKNLFLGNRVQIFVHTSFVLVALIVFVSLSTILITPLVISA